MFYIILTAFVCWTSAAPPSHPEQCQPSQPKDVTGVRTNEQQLVSAAQMAAVYPV